uniref:Uncharacterized protein n=1 Tax=Oryza punctata TaxID=4537 RepID=A0A0E0KSZ4_ORYPU
MASAAANNNSSSSSAAYDAAETGGLLRRRNTTARGNAAAAEEEEAEAAAPSVEQAFADKPVPSWSEQLTVRAFVVGFLLAIMFNIIVMKLSLTTGVIPSLNVSASLLGFFLVRLWTAAIERMGFLKQPFTRQENTVIQTCVVSAYGVAFSGGFGSYLFGMSETIAKQATEANDPMNIKNPHLGWIIGFMFLVSFVGLFALVPMRKVMIVDYKLTYPSGTATAYLINGFHTPEGADLAKKQVRTLGKYFSISFLWAFFQWFYTAGDNCGFSSFPTFGLEAFKNRFYFDFSPTYVGVGMICPYIVNVSLLIGGIISWGIMWPLISKKKGSWYPDTLPESSLLGLQAYKVFITIAVILGDGLYNFVKVFGYTMKGFIDMYKNKNSNTLPISHNGTPANTIEEESFDDKRRNELFLKDQIPKTVAIGGYVALAVITSGCLPLIIPQLKWYYILIAYMFAPIMAFCNAYGSGLTDWSLATTYGKLAIFVFGAWAGASHGGVLVGLAACGVMMNIVGTASDLMQDFKTGYMTLASPRSMFVSQVIGAAMGCVIAPCVFWLFYKSFDIGASDGAYPAPYTIMYRNMAILGVNGLSSLPKYCLTLCYIAFAAAFIINLIKDLVPERVAKYIPIPMAAAIPFYLGPYFAIDMFMGSVILYFWEWRNKDEAQSFGPAVASGLMCGDGLWALPQAVLSLVNVNPPLCMKFLSRAANAKVDTFLGNYSSSSAAYDAAETGGLLRRRNTTARGNAAAAEEEEAEAAAPSVEQAFADKPVPSWSEQLTVRAFVVGFLLAIMFNIIVMKLSLTTGVIPSLNVSASLLGFFLVRLWTAAIERMGFLKQPFTRQENTVIQTCVVSAYGVAFSGGFGSYLFGMSETIAKQATEANDPMNIKNPHLGWIIGFMFLVSFVGLFALVPMRKVMIVDYKLTYPSGTATAYLINGFHTPEGADLAKKQVRTLGKYFSISFLWAFFQWFYTAGDNCGFSSFPTFGLEAFKNRFYFDFSPTYVGVGMICPYIVNVSLLIGGIISWGIMWPLISKKKGSWYPDTLPESSLLGLQAYKVFGYTMKGFIDMYKNKNSNTLPISHNGTPANTIEEESFDDKRRNELFLKDQIPKTVAIGGYVALAVITSGCLPLIIPQLKWYYILIAYMFAPIMAFCNAYGSGLTDWSLATTYGKLAIFVFGAWAGASHGGVLVGLAACGVMMNIVGTASDLMQDFKTGYMTLASPRSMFVSQVIGAAMGCVIAPCVFWLFYKSFDIGASDGAYPAPYTIMYRNMAILGVNGLSSLPKYCLTLCYIAFAAAFIINLIKDLVPERVAKYIPIPMAAAIPFYLGPYFAIDMFMGSVILYFWEWRNKDEAQSFGPAVASGLMCGDGLWALPQAVLSLVNVNPPLCMKFLSRAANAKVDTFLGN